MIVDGLKVFAIGFGMVFVVLAILIGFIFILQKVLSSAKGSKGGSDAEAEKKRIEAENAKAEAARRAAAAAEKAAAAKAGEDENELVAVITAAVAAAQAAEGGSLNFRVRNITRVGNPWSSRSRNYIK